LFGFFLFVFFSLLSSKKNEEVKKKQQQKNTNEQKKNKNRTCGRLAEILFAKKKQWVLSFCLTILLKGFRFFTIFL